MKCGQRQVIYKIVNVKHVSYRIYYHPNAKVYKYTSCTPVHHVYSIRLTSPIKQRVFPSILCLSTFF